LSSVASLSIHFTLHLFFVWSGHGGSPLFTVFPLAGVEVTGERSIVEFSCELFSISPHCLGLCGCPVQLGGQAVPASHQEPGAGRGAGRLEDERGSRPGTGYLLGPFGCSPHTAAGGRGRLAASLRTDWTIVSCGQVCDDKAEPPLYLELLFCVRITADTCSPS
jgi:hypothetical protein